MKSQMRSWILASVIMMLLFCLTGCGAEISTLLNFDENFSGERIITCVVSKSDAEDSFEGGIDGVDAVIDQYCPTNLQCEKEDGGNSVIYTFTLSFVSFDDYKSQVEELLGRETEMTFRQPDSVFSSGVALEEDFDSRDILGWFKTVVEEEELMSDPSNLWELSSTTVMYGSEEISTSGTIRFDRIESNPVSEIQISTLNTEESIERSIIFDIPARARDTKKEQVDSYMNGLLPEDGQGTWYESDEGYLYEIVLTASSMDELSSDMTQIFGEGYLYESTIEDDDPFIRHEVIYECFDVFSFGDASDGALRVNCNYSFSEMDNRWLNSVDAEGWIEDEQYMFSDYTGIVEMAFRVTDVSVASGLEIIANLSEDGALDAAVGIEFPSGQTKQAEKAANYYRQAWDDIGVEVVSDGGEICRILLQDGQCPIEERLAAIFETDAVLWHVSIDEGMLKNLYDIEIDIDPANLAYRAGIEDATSDFTLVTAYALQVANQNGIDLEEVEGENELNFKNIQGIRLHAAAAKTNPMGVVMVVLMILAALAILTFGFVYLIKYLSKRDGRQDEPLGGLVKEYIMRGANAAKAGLIAFGAALAHGMAIAIQVVKDFLKNYYPEGANKKLITYFYGSRTPVFIILLGVIVIPMFFYLLSWIISLFGSSSYGTNAIILSTVVPLISNTSIVVAVIWYLVEKFKTDPEAEAEYDRVFTYNMARLKDSRGLDQLGLVSEQVALVEPLKLVGPDYYTEDLKKGWWQELWRFVRRAFIYESRLVMKRGSDGKTRYSCAAQNFWYFSECQLYRYEINYDICIDSIRAESTSETFYQDLTSVSSQEKTIKLRSLFTMTSKVFQTFIVVTESGTSLEATVDSGCVSNTEIAAGIQAMQNLARDRKATCVDKKRKRRSKV